MQDELLILQLKERQGGAFETLVSNYQDMVVNTCYGFLHNREDAEDLAQDVFIEVLRSIGRFRGDAKLSTWLYRIAVNKSLDLLRKRKRRGWMGSIVSFFGDEEKVKEIEDKKGSHPQADLEQAERVEILQSAINKLAEKQRIAFTLHKYEGLSHKEIAKVMDTSVSAVESLMHRAKKSLRTLLHEYYHS